MQKSSVLAVIAAAMTLSALVANHAFGRLHELKPRVLPLETFPRHIGDWMGGEDRPVADDVHRIIKTARITDRDYTSSHGQRINLTLVTAADYNDFHNPNICFPAQGWELTDQQEIKIGTQPVHSMKATQGSEQLSVLYWFVGDKQGLNPNSAMGKLMAIRKLLTKQDEVSLFVRLTTPIGAANRKSLIEFAEQVMPHLRALARNNG